MRHFFLLLWVAIMAAGCATVGGDKISLAGENGTKVERVISPAAMIGIRETPAVVRGDFLVYVGNFPSTPEMWAEWDFRRMTFNVLVYGEKSGNLYPAQAIFAGQIECQPRIFIIVEGRNQTEPLIGAFATTHFDMLFTLYGETIRVDSTKIREDAVHRKDVVIADGTKLAKLNPVGSASVRDVFDSWEGVKIQSIPEVIRTPLPRWAAETLLRGNPQIQFLDKIKANTSGSVYMSATATLVAAFADIAYAAGVPDRGFDRASVSPRMEQGFNMAFREAMIRESLKSGDCNGRRQIKY